MNDYTRTIPTISEVEYMKLKSLLPNTESKNLGSYSAHLAGHKKQIENAKEDKFSPLTVNIIADKYKEWCVQNKRGFNVDNIASYALAISV